MKQLLFLLCLATQALAQTPWKPQKWPILKHYDQQHLTRIAIPIVLWMRQTTKTDDQRLRQVMMRARMRLRHGPSRATWGAISYGPLAWKTRRS